MLASDSDQRPIRATELPVSLNTVRLVVPLKAPKSNLVRDVIVKEIVSSEKPVGKWKHLSSKYLWAKQERIRYIAGEPRIEIPWPKKLDEDHKDQPNDTLRIDVEHKTFVPTLLRPPMPPSVIDELRNKYSVFRTRHEPEYIEAKLAEERALDEKKKQISQMMTPLKAINKVEKRLRRKMGRRQELTPLMMAKIGEVIARKKNITSKLSKVQQGVPLKET